MAFGLLFSFLPLLLSFVLIRAITGRGKGAVGGHPVRHFFQYMIMYGLVIVVALGLVGLLERVLPHERTIYSSTSDLAQALAFTIVGIPLLALLATWTRRRFATDPVEREAFGWGIYLTFAGITSLVVALQSLQNSILWAFGNRSDGPTPLAMAIVWSAVWGVHWWLDRVVTRRGQTTLHHGLGSVIGLAWATTGLGMLLAAVLRSLLPMHADTMLSTNSSAFVQGGAVFIVGAIAWYCYWIRTYALARRDVVWDAYVMVVGIAGGLVTAVVALSVVLYQTLVWFLGSTSTTDASQHFRSAPAAASAALVGMLVWWYHRAVFGQVARTGRSEGQRIYEYLVGAIGLIAAAVGLTVMLVALMESLTASSAIAGSGGPRNTLLLAATLLLVGAPVWWIFWHRIETAVGVDRSIESASPARRFYLFMLFGIGGTAAVISLLVAVYQLFNDVVAGEFGSGTVRNMRWGVGVLLTAGAVAGYHWLVYRGERDVAAPGRRLKYVLLAGVADRELARSIAERTSAHVDAWLGTGDVDAAVWSTDAVAAVLDDVDAAEVVVVAEPGGLRVIPVDRR